MPVKNLRQTVQGLLPSLTPVRFVAEDGTPVAKPAPGYTEPAPEALREAYRRMVVGRRFDTQATALTKQGRLAVYPSSRGQEACQIGAVLALRPDDWLFPTYRDSVALVARGIDPLEVLTLLRGDWHCGYDPAATRVAPSAPRWPLRCCTRPAWRSRCGAQAETVWRWPSSGTGRPVRGTSTRR